MKHKNKLKRLERRLNDFKNDRAVQQANLKHPGSYHKPGSIK